MKRTSIITRALRPGRPDMAAFAQRWGMAARLLAIPASYALASMAAACVARLVPFSRVEAATTGMLILFALCALLILWVFSAKSVLRLWLWFGGSALVLGSILLVSLQIGGRA